MMRDSAALDEQGVAMIEFALVLTFLAVLVFGIIDFGYTLSDYQNVRQGVREAAREVASNPSQFTVVTSPPTPLSSTCSAFAPAPTSTEECFTDFIVARTGVSASQLTVSWSSAAAAPRPLSGGTPFEVCVDYATKSITGFASSFLPKTLHADVVMRMEPTSSPFPTPPVSLAPCV